MAPTAAVGRSLANTAAATESGSALPVPRFGSVSVSADAHAVVSPLASVGSGGHIAGEYQCLSELLDDKLGRLGWVNIDRGPVARGDERRPLA